MLNARLHCSYCGSKLHTVTNCPKTWGGQGARNAMRCTYCGSASHNIDACPKIASSHRHNPDSFVLDKRG